MRQGITFLLACYWIVVGSVEVHGSGSAAISLHIDPSIRAQGMGGASSAAFWGGDPNYWANPALLGYHRGLRYEYGKTQLVPDLATDVFFTSTRYSVGAWGVGFAFGGKPGQLGGSRLDYGRSDFFDANGNFAGSFDSFENVETWGVGVNVV
ncbi:MAG: hypothetical protein GWN29_07575, partial [Gammaproteobacteria bacterium]|nr:hypothetical protein [Gammaproteobacteria bacterium]